MWSSMCQAKDEKSMPTYTHGTMTPGMFSSTWRSRLPSSPARTQAVRAALQGGARQSEPPYGRVGLRRS